MYHLVLSNTIMIVDCHKTNAMQIKIISKSILAQYITFSEKIMELNSLIDVFEHVLNVTDGLHATHTDF